jgi:hypothetical protein
MAGTVKTMKFSGRETSVLRAIDFATGTLGAEVLVKTRIDAFDALDILNSLVDAGYIEANPAPPDQEPIKLKDFYHTRFEVNPAYAHELKKTFIRS